MPAPAPATEDLSDPALVARAKAGDYEAFESLVKRHQRRIYAVCLGMLKSPPEAEEVTQETFLSAFQKLDSFREESAFFTWIYRVAMNHCLMRIRKKRPEAAGGAEDLELRLDDDHSPSFAGRAAEAPDRVVHQHEVEAALDAALGALSDDDRAILLLRAFDGLPNQEIADLLDSTVPAVKSRLHRARLLVREIMLEQMGDDRV